MHTLRFKNGDVFPEIGIGTWKSTTDEVYDSVFNALKTGYRHIDCAYLYMNEKQVGEAIRDAINEGITTRDALFITSKLWNSYHHPEDVESGIRRSLHDLGLDYLDLYLIHWPVVFRKGVNMPSGPSDLIHPDELPLADTWSAMQNLQSKGFTRHLGVSNFSVSKMKSLMDKTGISPEVCQVEIHPYFQQNDLVNFCRENQILLTAYYPLGGPYIIGSDKDLFKHPEITRIAAKHQATPAQILLAWGMNRGYAVIPKSIRAERIKENYQSVYVSLDEDDMHEINCLDAGMRISRATYSIFEGGYYTYDNIFE